MDDSKEPPRSLEDIDQRLRSLRAREEVRSGRQGQKGGAGAGMGLGFRVAVELLAGIAVGGGLGYGLDRWFGSKPWLMVVLLFAGAAAGLLNAYRAVRGLDDSVGLGGAQRRAQGKGQGGNEGE